MTSHSEFRLVFCTCPDRESAERIALALVERQLAACVNILPGLRSVYRWQGQVEQSDEHLLLIKSTAGAYPALEHAVKTLHPYELPEIVAVRIGDGLPGYLEWMMQSVEDGA